MLRAVVAARHETGVWSTATVNAHLSGLRGVITEAWRLGYMTAWTNLVSESCGWFMMMASGPGQLAKDTSRQPRLV